MTGTWRRRRLALAAVAGVLGLAPAGRAHPPARAPVRDIVRMQGHLGSGGPREVAVLALGLERRFVVTEWREFSLGERRPADPPAGGARLVLQGERAVLARFTTARPEQTVTVLAERRPGSADLFVLTLDRCPP